MVFCTHATSWADGLYQLPDAVADVRTVFLRRRLWMVWKIADPSIVLCGSRCVAGRNSLESCMVKALPVRADGMALAQSYLLEKTTYPQIRYAAIGKRKRRTRGSCLIY